MLCEWEHLNVISPVAGFTVGCDAEIVDHHSAQTYDHAMIVRLICGVVEADRLHQIFF